MQIILISEGPTGSFFLASSGSFAMVNNKIVIDFSSLDHLNIRNGQYRYVVDLVCGLAARADGEFVLLGSRAAPVAELRNIFESSAWRYVQYLRYTGPGHYYRNQLSLALMARRQGAQLLHVVHSPVPVLSSCPLVVTSYDLMFELFPEYNLVVKSRAYRIDRWAVRHRARRIIAISAATANDLITRWGIERDRIDVVPLGSSFVTARKLSCDIDRRTRFLELCFTESLLSPYNLEPRKNLAALLKAVAIVRRNRPNIKLLLFGHAAITAEREQLFERSVAELELQDAVHLLGPLDDKDLAWLYSHTTVFVFPSLYEGFGLPVLEAMALGACVIVRNASAMAEIAQHNAALLVETADSDVLAAAISALLDAPERRALLRQAARQRAAEYTIDQMVKLTCASYDKALRHK